MSDGSPAWLQAQMDQDRAEVADEQRSIAELEAIVRDVAAGWLGTKPACDGCLNSTDYPHSENCPAVRAAVWVEAHPETDSEH